MNKKPIILTLLLSTSLTATAQHITADSTTINLGAVMFRRPAVATFVLRNDGRKPLRITNVETSCGCTGVDYPRRSIGAGKTFELRAIYDAATMGHFEKQIDVYSNAQHEPLQLTIRGLVSDQDLSFTGQYPYSIGDLQASANNLEFDDVNRGEQPSVVLHIKNATGETLRPQAMHLPSWLQARFTPATLPPGREGIATIKLDSRQLRDFGLTQSSFFLGSFPGDNVAESKEITVSVVLLPSFPASAKANDGNQPEVALSSSAFNLKASSGNKMKGQIVITNTGRQPLKITSLQMFTAGIEVQLNRTTLQPGQNAKLKITAYTDKLRSARSKPRVLMITNDPKNPKIIIPIKI